MPLLKRRKGQEERGTKPRVVLAAAVPITGPDARDAWTARQTDTSWQKEAWYFYDAVGELRSAVTWIANAVSRAQLYAAEVDPGTGMPSGPTDNAKASAAVAAALGGAAKRSQLQYTMAVNWQIPGEVFVLVRPGTGVQADEWVALSGTEVDYTGSRWSYKDPMTGIKRTLADGDLLMRVWSPHPRVQYCADSAVRPSLPVLREIEKASQNIAARLDSRLAGNGLLFLPEEINFPEQDSGAVGAEGFMEYLAGIAAKSMQNPGTAAAQVPVMAQIPSELIASIKHIDLVTAFDAAVVALRTDGIKRLAEGLDMPNEVATGSTGDANHWGSWKVEEDTYKIYIEPLLDRIADALTTHWYRPTLKSMGVPNPESYMLAWNTSEIVQRPNRVEDLKWLHDNELISDDAMRAEVGVPEDDIPSGDEVHLRRLARVVLSDPSLATDPEISRRLFGFELTPPPRAPVQIESGLPTQPEAVANEGSRTLPATQNDQPPALAASAAPPEHLIAATELLVFDALSRAGGRLLKAPLRGQFGAVAKHELYLKIPYDPAGEGVVDKLLEGSFQFTGHVAEAFGRDPEQMSTQVEEYVTTLLMTRSAHDRAMLRRFL